MSPLFDAMNLSNFQDVNTSKKGKQHLEIQL